MAGSNASMYLKRMVPSLILMVLITYGIKESNPWLQYGSILLILFGQIAYQGIKAVLSRSDIEANLEEARRVLRRKQLLTVNERDVERAKEGGKSVGGITPKLSLLLILPLIIFLATGYILSFLFPGIPNWQSYLVGFIITMPISMVISIRSGLGSPRTTASPNAYYISERGIVYEHMGQHYILHYPLKDLETKEESNCLEVEGQETGTAIIPNKLRLFSRDFKKIRRLLTNYMED